MPAHKATVPITHTVLIAGVPVLATVTARPAIARRWVLRATRRWGRRLRSGTGLTVGIGVQWTPSFRAPGASPPAPGTLQLCVGNRCLVFQLAQAGTVPAGLRRFLADARVTFAGYNVAADCRVLRDHHGLVVAAPMEIRDGNASMEEMAARLLGVRGGVTKSRKVGVSSWDVVRLSKKQVRYACVDAYLSCRLGVHLRRNAMHEDQSESE